MTRMFELGRLPRRLLALTVGAAGVGGVLGLATPMATRWIVETLAPAGDIVRIAVVALGLALIGCCAAFVAYRGGVWSQTAWIRWERSTMASTLRRLIGAPLTFHRQTAPAAAIGILRGAVQAREALAAAGLAAATALAVLLASGAYLVWTAPEAGAGALAGLGLFSLVAALLLRAQTRARLAAADAESEETGFLSAALRAGLGPGGAAGRPHMVARWAAIHSARVEASRQALLARDAQRALDAAAGGLAPAGLIWLAAVGAPTPGELAAIYSAFGQCMMAALGLSAAAARLSQAQEGIRMLARLPEPEPETSVGAPDRALPAVQAEGIAFAYPGGQPILKELTLTLAAGEILALMGPSGVGKSTLIRLIGGLDSPTDGGIRVFGRDPTTLSPAERRELFGVAAGEVPALDGDATPDLLGQLLAGRPPLALIDEAAAGRDAAFVEALFDGVRAIGAAAVVATHNPEVARRCDRVLELSAPN